MLRCEMDVYEAIDAALMEDTELMAEIEAEVYETPTEAEADEFIDWLYNEDDKNNKINEIINKWIDFIASNNIDFAKTGIKYIDIYGYNKSVIELEKILIKECKYHNSWFSMGEEIYIMENGIEITIHL